MAVGARIVSQREQVLDYLRDGNSLTPLEALSLFGSIRLGARIYELRNRGYDIKKEMVRVKTSRGEALVAEYRL